MKKRKGRPFTGGMILLFLNYAWTFWRVGAAGKADFANPVVFVAGLVLTAVFFLPALLTSLAFQQGLGKGQWIFPALQGLLLTETALLLPYVETAIQSDALGGLLLWIVSAAHLVTIGGVLLVFRREIWASPPPLPPAQSGA